MQATEKTKPYNITVKFRAPLDAATDMKAKKEINYDEFRHIDEFQLLKTGEFERYAYMQCLKIGFYLQKVRQIELL